MRLNHLIILLVWCVASLSAYADPLRLMAEDRNPAAPEELSHMALLIGDWQIQWEAVDAEGNVQATGRADWHWRWVMDGYAIQDVWLNPSLDQPVTGSRFHGINLRIYNPTASRWEMTWITNQAPGTTLYHASSTPEQIEMRPAQQPETNRIIFYNMTGDSFEWVSENSSDGGETWIATFRIRGERLSD